MHKWSSKSGFPVVITIFSAPNYCDVYNNKGAIIKFKGQEINIQQFNYTAHPYILPNFMDVFSWSIPFVVEKVTEILLATSDAKAIEEGKDEEEPTNQDVQKKLEDDKQDDSASKTKLGSKADLLRKKVRTMSRMLKMLKTLREERESLTQLRGLCPDGQIPRGLILEGSDAINNALDQFQKAKELDKKNDAIPSEEFASSVLSMSESNQSSTNLGVP